MSGLWIVRSAIVAGMLGVTGCGDRDPVSSTPGTPASGATGKLTVSGTRAGGHRPNRPPVANAGTHQSVRPGTTVILDATGSRDADGDALTYQWTAPSGVTLSDATAARPTFTAAAPGTYRFGLVVSDRRATSLADAVVVTVASANRAPVADAGPDQTVEVGAAVTLDGTGSSDADGDPLTYQWTAQEGVTLSDATVASPTFTAPGAGTFVFSLVVSDGEVRSAADEVVVTVSGGGVPARTLTTELPGGATMDFVWIEPGTFVMGDAELGNTPHQVTLTRGFWLGEYEVTQGQWEAVMGTTPWLGESHVQWNAQCPAVNMSWYDVQSLVHRLNQAEGDSVYRLPTEGEWEYACRAGTTTRWSFGDDESRLGDYAWYYNNAWRQQYAHVVGTKQANPWGLFDMHGNASEWVQDWYGSYPNAAQTDPGGPGGGSGRVRRGGDFLTLAQGTLSAFRYNFWPDTPTGYLGCRLVRMETPLPLAPPTGPPTSHAGPDQGVEVGATVTLDGSASSDPDGDVLSYKWTAPEGITLSDPTVPSPTFAAPAAGTFVFSLVVSDGRASSAADEVVVTVFEAAASVQTLTADLPGGATMEFVWIEPGTFMMGDAELGLAPHQVTLTQGYWLGRCEVTQGQWEAAMGTTPWSGHRYVQSDPQCPAVYISWYDVKALVDRLNQAEGDSVYRLPTEAEWEYACRAGTTSRWSCGDDESRLRDYAWYNENAWTAGQPYAHAVGTKRANPWGLFDMHGNVLEWVSDWYDGYPSAAQTEPGGPGGGSGRVIRGGCFYYDAQYASSAKRDIIPPGVRASGLGCRLSRTP
ncbi:MAG: SUMF1/EgtB/PvdO family nonheme iron enzyme [Candidatus Latescibacterota bacterium]